MRPDAPSPSMSPDPASAARVSPQAVASAVIAACGGDWCDLVGSGRSARQLVLRALYAGTCMNYTIDSLPVMAAAVHRNHSTFIGWVSRHGLLVDEAQYQLEFRRVWDRLGRPPRVSRGGVVALRCRIGPSEGR